MAEGSMQSIPDIVMDSPKSSTFPFEDIKTEISGTETYDTDSITDESSVDDDHHVPQGLPLRSLPTGLCYDERMRYHSEVYAPSSEAVHPEDPRRIYYIFKELCEAGLVVAKGYSLMVEQPLLRIDAREATEEEVRLVHNADHFDFVKATATMSNSDLIDRSDEGDSIYYNQLSYFAGMLSAGGAIETCKAVMERRVKNAVAVIRPPGHHAEVEQPMGFCLFNNTCVASRVCQDLFGEACRKILILDWDVHHGNGCQKAFYDDPNILYISLHVHMDGQFYPPGPAGGMDRVGTGAGLGYNVNIPWKTKGMGDADYMYAFQQVVMPIANQFNPDFVIVSAGFDAAAGDELGGCNVTPPCYAHMTHMLMSLAGGKVAVCLEGGYNFKAISRSALAVTRTLMGEPPDRLDPTSPTRTAVEVVEEVKAIHSKFWHSLYPKAPVAGIYGGERLHDIIRQYQAQHYFDDFKLTELYILRPSVSRSFEKQVLATISYENKKHLLVFFHDPPDLMIKNDPLQPQQTPHNTYMIDGTQAYLERAITHNMGIIEINIPQFITPVGSSSSLNYNDPSPDARVEAAKLATYIWDNYIQPYDFDGGIFFAGAGHAFDAIVRLVNYVPQAIQDRVTGIIGFLGAEHTNKRIDADGTNAELQRWYVRNSRIFVSDQNNIWSYASQGKKISRRYGTIVKVEETVVNQIMLDSVDSAFAFIEEHCDEVYPLYKQPVKREMGRATLAEDVIMSGSESTSPEQLRVKSHVSRATTPRKGQAAVAAGVSLNEAVRGPPQ